MITQMTFNDSIVNVKQARLPTNSKWLHGSQVFKNPSVCSAIRRTPHLVFIQGGHLCTLISK